MLGMRERVLPRHIAAHRIADDGEVLQALRLRERVDDVSVRLHRCLITGRRAREAVTGKVE